MAGEGSLPPPVGPPRGGFVLLLWGRVSLEGRSRDAMYMCMHTRMQGVCVEWWAHAHVPMSMCMHMHVQGVHDEWRAQLAGVEAEVTRLGLAKAEQSHVDRALDE